MSKRALLYNASGDIVGHLHCSNDDDLTRQEAPHIEVAPEHEARQRPEQWRVTIEGGKPVLAKRPVERARGQQ